VKLYSSHGSGGNGKDGLLLKVNVSRDLVTIENEKDFHGGMADPLVTVNKGMALDERKAECGGLVEQSWVQVGTVKGSHWLCERGFEAWEVSDTRSAAGDCDEIRVKPKDLSE